MVVSDFISYCMNDGIVLKAFVWHSKLDVQKCPNRQIVNSSNYLAFKMVFGLLGVNSNEKWDDDDFMYR
jgi:hypothetical protein